jgi:hypothetical protein
MKPDTPLLLTQRVAEPLTDARYAAELRRALVVHATGPALTDPDHRAAAWSELLRARRRPALRLVTGGDAA